MSDVDQFEPRRAKPNETFTYTDPEGKAVNIHADEDGVVRPRNQKEVVVLDGYDLPVARKVVEEERAAAEAAPRRRERP